MTDLITAIDIETAADPHTNPPTAEPKLGRLVDPDKIAAKQQEAQNSLNSKLALDPYFSRIIAFSWATTGYYTMEKPYQFQEYEDVRGQALHISSPHEYTTRGEHITDIAEKRLLNNLIHNHIIPTIQQGGIIATFNGTNFDLPFIATRMLLLRKKMPTLFDERQDGITGQHLDLLISLTAHEPGHGRGFSFKSNTGTRRNLTFYSKRLLKNSPHEQLPELDKSQNHTNIENPTTLNALTQHAKADALATLRLAKLHYAYNQHTPIR